MNNLIILLQAAQQATDAEPTFMEKYGSLFFIVAIIAVFWLLFIRPQSKKAKEEKFLPASLPFCYAPTQLVAPRAVRMANAMEAISWITNFTVSFFVIVVCF